MYFLDQMKLAYIGECVEGDTLTIKVWCPENTERTVICSMEKDNKRINQVTLSFYHPEQVEWKGQL